MKETSRQEENIFYIFCTVKEMYLDVLSVIRDRQRLIDVQYSYVSSSML